MWPNPQETADLVTFTEEIYNGKLIICAVSSSFHKVYWPENARKLEYTVFSKAVTKKAPAPEPLF